MLWQENAILFLFYYFLYVGYFQFCAYLFISFVILKSISNYGLNNSISVDFIRFLFQISKSKFGIHNET